MTVQWKCHLSINFHTSLLIGAPLSDVAGHSRYFRQLRQKTHQKVMSSTKKKMSPVEKQENSSIF